MISIARLAMDLLITSRKLGSMSLRPAGLTVFRQVEVETNCEHIACLKVHLRLNHTALILCLYVTAQPSPSSAVESHHSEYSRTQLLYLPQKRLAVTSSAIVVLTASLDSHNLPKEGLSGLKVTFSWRDT